MNTDKVAIITAGGSGMGAAAARKLAADGYRVGISPPSFDKQFVRDWLETQTWDKTPPAPRLPKDVLDKTAAKYREALDRLIA